MFATITGSEWINTPYSAHNPAATPCTRRNPLGPLVKYDTRNTADTVKLLLDRGADPQPGVSLAAMKGHIEVLKLLKGPS